MPSSRQPDIHSDQLRSWTTQRALFTCGAITGEEVHPFDAGALGGAGVCPLFRDLFVDELRLTKPVCFSKRFEIRIPSLVVVFRHEDKALTRIC